MIASWPESGSRITPGAARLLLADLDNNGALDVLASGAAGTGIWLAGEDYTFARFAGQVDADIWSVIDLSRRRSARSGRRCRRAGPCGSLGRGTRGYHWQVIRPRAQPTAGDQRINSFGVGGDIEIRSGLLSQKQTITGPPVHFGLGTRTSVDVARIVWPNGVLQAEFDRRRRSADRRASSGSRDRVPWVFADDGTGMRFVTDFLWRSPLGLRINAQDTAGVTQTEDWVRIRGDQLVAAGRRLRRAHHRRAVGDALRRSRVAAGRRSSRRTPRCSSTSGSRASAPALAVQAMRLPQPVARAWDETGRDVTDLVNRQDGRYLATFERGPYQGIATDHFVEIELGEEIPARPADVARRQRVGSIRPTAASTSRSARAGECSRSGLSLEAQDARGRWVVVAPDLGFPAGKNKTILIDLASVARAGVAHARRLRLRTNLEIYWDSLARGRRASSDAPTQTVRLQPERAELRYRGFSETDYATARRARDAVYDQHRQRRASAGAISPATTRASATCASCSPASTIAT